MHAPTITPAKRHRPERALLACILTPWLLVAAVLVAMLAGCSGQQSTGERLDVNGEPLSYNAPCSTDTDCVERFGY